MRRVPRALAGGQGGQRQAGRQRQHAEPDCLTAEIETGIHDGHRSVAKLLSLLL
jgi:hypothetical protein